MKILHNITHPRSQGLIDYACRYANKAHGKQLRKYTNEPYIVHPIEVAQIVASRTMDCNMICAALLHDTIEDTDVTYDILIKDGFSPSTANLVQELTEKSVPSDGNRAKRKQIDLEYLATVSAQAQTIKLADLISNTSSICAYDKKFAVVYMREKQLLLEVLTKGDKVLLQRAKDIVDNYYKELDQ